MKRYIEIQKEVTKDLQLKFNIDINLLDLNFKNSKQSCYNTFYKLIYYIYKSDIIAKDITTELMKKYELYTII